jgi:hypothetical protein
VKKAFDEKAKVEYVELFKEYSGGTDSISRETFKKTVKQLGMSLTDQYFDERFASWDADKSGTITRDEFLAFCTSELDKGQKREVVFKFMKNEDQFKRELEARDNGGDKLDPRFIVGVTKHFEGDDFRAAVASIEELAEYKCVRAKQRASERSSVRASEAACERRSVRAKEDASEAKGELKRRACRAAVTCSRC